MSISALLVVGGDVHYLGCFSEKADDNDLDGYKETITPEEVIDHRCISTCKMKGRTIVIC